MGRVGSQSWIPRSLIALIAVVLCLVPNAAAAATVAATDAVNIRSCPDIACDIVSVALLGAELEITGEAVDGFVPVRHNGTAGYAYGLYVGGPLSDPWLTSGEAGCNRVALIFNIGIGEPPSWTVLDTLVDRDVAATMFPMGWWAEAYPDYLLALDEAGFVIGTHGHDMLMLSTLGPAQIAYDVNASASAIQSVLGYEPARLHTPYAADTSPSVRQVVANMGYMPVGWTVAAADYGPDATSASVYGRVMSNVHDGAIVEFHLDGPATESSTAVALPWIIDELRAAGYELVTVPEMAQPCM